MLNTDSSNNGSNLLQIENQTDEAVKGPCPVTGGPICTCDKKQKQDDHNEDIDSGVKSAGSGVHGGAHHGPAHTAAMDSTLPADKQMEQHMVLRMVPDGSETHRAINSGSWFDPNTWEGGVIPGDGARVYIPAGVSVEYDDQSAAQLWTVRVDGDLNFSETDDTKMVVDTLVVMHNGELNIGTKEQAVDNGVTAEIVFSKHAVDLDDPMQMGLGLVSIGEVNVHGQEKQSHLKVADIASKGDTSLTLEEVPAGWRVGDRIVLTGTEYNPDWSNGKNLDQSQDEELVITGIQGNTITFDTPLEYDHHTPREDLSPYVANLSRNVIFRSEETADISQRGHVMLMHNDAVDIRYAQFTELGRTDKSKEIGGDDNVNGRYALHLHRQGVELDSNPAMVVGNSVEGSPGWGYVHHASYAVMDYNVAYDVFGGSFIAESGDETGRWEHNIAIKGTGIGTKGGSGHPKDAHGTLKAANNGTGFYFQGRLVHNQNNVAASMPGYGFSYFHRPTEVSVDVDASTVEASQTTRFKTNDQGVQVSADAPSIQGFEDNEVFATKNGLSVIKNHPNQHHDNRSILDGFTAWEVQSGVSLEYTGHYTLNDFDLVAKEGRQDWRSNGLSLGQRVVDLVANDLQIDGFAKGVNVGRNNNFDGNDLPESVLLVDYETTGVETRLESDHSNGHIKEIQASQLTSSPLELNLASSAELHIDSTGGQEKIILRGTKTDSSGTHTHGFIEKHASLQGMFHIELGGLIEQGYYTLPDGQKAVILPELIVDRVSGAEAVKDVVLTVDEKFIKQDTPNLGQLNATDANNDGVWDTNSAAHAAFDTIDVAKNGSVVFSVFDNDSDIDGDAFELQSFTNVDDGNLQLVNRSTGTFRYTPDANEDGYDFFEYTISDTNGSGRSSSSRVQLKIDAGFSSNASNDGLTGVTGQLANVAAMDESFQTQPAQPALTSGDGELTVPTLLGSSTALGGQETTNPFGDSLVIDTGVSPLEVDPNAQVPAI